MSESPSRHLVDPELLPFLDLYPAFELSSELLPQLRQLELENIPPVEQDSVEVSTVEVAGPAKASAVSLRIYLPEAKVDRPLGCIFHVHGGGFIGGSARQVEFYVRPIARELGCAIVSVDYRLAPEHPHPAPIEDCYTGLSWLFKNAVEYGIDTSRIGVMGESAGAGLAAALALMTRDRGELGLAFQLLTYPMIDDRTCTREGWPHVGEFVWTRQNNRFGWAALLGREPGAEGVDAYAAAARAEDLAGLPPTYIETVSLDLFLEENIEYARRLAEAAVPIEFHIWPGAYHGFELGGETALLQRVRQSKLTALRRFLSA